MFTTGTSPGPVPVSAVLFALHRAGEYATTDELLARRIEKRLKDDDKPPRVSRRGGRILIEIVEAWGVAK